MLVSRIVSQPTVPVRASFDGATHAGPTGPVAVRYPGNHLQEEGQRLKKGVGGRDRYIRRSM